MMAWTKGVGRSGPAGTALRGAGGQRPRKVRSGGWQWSEEAEAVFFDSLAASANVLWSAGEAGFSTPTVYRLRRKRADFAGKWEAALAQGYARLEAALLRSAADSIEGLEFDDERPIPRMSVEQALNVLRAHRSEVRGASESGRGPGKAGRELPIEAVRDSILRKLEAIAAAGEDEVPEAYRDKSTVAPAKAGAHDGCDEAAAVPHRPGSQPSLG